MNGVETPPLVNLQEIAEIELFILRRMKEYTLGDHASVFKGSGFNFVGSRDWQPGDRMSHIDWAQSSMTNFSPLVTREFEQDSTATVLVVADASMSTRCGAAGVPIAAAIARSIAAVGLSAVFFQDQFGLITFDDAFHQVAAVRPADRQAARDLLPRTVPAAEGRGRWSPGRVTSRPASRATCARRPSCRSSRTFSSPTRSG